MSAHRILHDMFRAPFLMADPGDAGTITVNRDRAVVPVVTAAAETRTLAVPTKAGLMCMVVLDTYVGDLTLTVTSGYNQAGTTAIVLGDAGDFVIFVSVKIGATYRWRVVAQEGTTAAVTNVTATTATIDTQSRPTVEAAEHGAGAIGTAFAPRTYRYERDGVIITDIEIDLTGLDSSGVANDVIGLNTGGAAYIGRNVVATNGVIFKVVVTCLEVPLTGDADILFVAGSAADEAFDATVADTQTIADGTGDWALGETIVLTAPTAIAANYYYYMTQGSTDDATYTAGQFLLRFYGKAPLS